MNDAEITNDMQQSARILTPSPGASLTTSFRLLTGLAFGVASVVALPATLVLHRRVGKRAMSSVVFGVSLVVLMLLGCACSAIQVVLSSLTTSGTELEYASTLHQSMVGAVPFGLMGLASTIGFFAHYCANRKRFGTPAQNHSMDDGISWLIFPPARFIKGWALRHSSLSIFMPAPSHPNAKEASAYPLSILGSIQAALKHHINMLAQGQAPYGPFAWFFTSIVEPLTLSSLGLLIAVITPFASFGIYLAIVAAVLFAKASILAAIWREKIYDDADARMETTALRNWRSGKPLINLSDVFTVPVSQAILPPLAPKAGNPVMIGPGFDHLLPSLNLSTEPTSPQNQNAA